MSTRIAIVALWVVTVSAPAFAATPIHFYDFEGDADDRVGSADGVVSGGALLTAGFEGQGYDLDGTNDFVQLPIDIRSTTIAELTMGLWVNADSTAVIQGILSHDDGGFDRTLDYDSRPGGAGYAAFNGGGVLNSGVTALDQWVFLAVSYDGTTTSLWVDDQKFTSGDTTDNGSGELSVLVGKNPNFDLFFNGQVDNVFFYDMALDDNAIAAIRMGGADAILGDDNGGGEIPEPASAMMLLGALGAMAARRKSRTA